MDINRINQAIISINQRITGHKCGNKPEYVQKDWGKGKEQEEWKKEAQIT
ncbi:MAG: hypothetical protein MR817_03805 [Lachnospiraceae bacterium]|nr:hypothetical protein [Lachnospiraceae bacterium]